MTVDGLEVLIPEPQKMGTSLRLATVTQASPLRIRLDGDTAALPYTPACLASAGVLAVDSRVLCLASSGHLVVVGAVGGTYNAPCPHAVGDYYMTENTTAPSTRWPGTTWVELAGRVLVGRDSGQTEFDTIGEQGGHKALHAHMHWVGHGDTDGNSDGAVYTGGGGATFGFTPSVVNGTPVYPFRAQTAGTGNGQNLQPYRVVYIWRRTA